MGIFRSSDRDAAVSRARRRDFDLNRSEDRVLRRRFGVLRLNDRMSALKEHAATATTAKVFKA